MIELKKYDGAKIRCLYLKDKGYSLDSVKTKSIREDLSLLDTHYENLENFTQDLSDLSILIDLEGDVEIKKELDEDFIPYFKNSFVLSNDYSKLYLKMTEFEDFRFCSYLLPVADILESKLN